MFRTKRVFEMRAVIRADDGDEVSVCADFEQSLVTLAIENRLYGAESELESVKLTSNKARELAKTLTSVADALECASV
jgi:hypothetical protein